MNYLRKGLTVLLLICSVSGYGQVVVKEHIQTGWKFGKIVRPSKSDAALNANITITGNKAIASCLSPDGLHNGVLPQECRLLRDFFCFTNDNTHGGKIVMDLGKVIPVSMINSYSAHGPVGGTTWCEEFDGSRGPQVYTVYGSARTNPDPSNLSTAEWVKIADVDTRPSDPKENWQGQYGVNIKANKNQLIGSYRWIAWDVRPSLKSGSNPSWTNTWFTELDVHTPETQAGCGDAVPAGTQLEEIIIAYKTHFDIGFTHPAPEIVNSYRTDMIDKALEIIEQSLQLPPEKQFSWTIPSWVAYQILWDGQDAERKEKVVNAIKSGHIVVHGLPVTLQTESLSLQDLIFGLALNRVVSENAGIAMSRSGKMTDVPSHSWVWPTLFKHAGMDFLHIGVNPVNERPDVPLLYYWEGPDSSRLLTMHSQGYGSDTEFGHGLFPPKDWPYKHWLALLVSTDNAGPPRPEDVASILKEAEEKLPGVKIRYGKMEDFADAIFEEEKRGAEVPVVRADMPDCWIHGVGTMPVEDSIAHETRTRLTSAELLDSHMRIWGLPRGNIRDQLFRAHERSLMYGEHTFGGARNLSGKKAYSVNDFEEFIKNDSDCIWLTKTWKDHADYINEAARITDSVSLNEMDQLAGAVAVEGRRIVVYNPLPYKRDAIIDIPFSAGKQCVVKDIPPCGYKTVLPDQLKSYESIHENTDHKIIENKFYKITIDRKKGGIISVINKKDQRELVDQQAKYAFGQYFYERFDSVQNRTYHLGCVHLNTVYGSDGRGCWGWNTRADLPPSPSYQCSVPEYEEMEVVNTATAVNVSLKASAKGIIRSNVTMKVTIPHNYPWIEIAIRLDDKKPDYWPEAGSVYLPVNAENPQFRIGRLGAVVDPAKDFVRGSNRTYGYVNTGAIVANDQGKGLCICPLDQGIMSFGTKGLCTIDPDYIPDTPLALANIYNTVWTINFPYWIKGELSSRVRIWASDNLDAPGLIDPASEAFTPVLTGYAEGSAGNLPAMSGGLEISRSGVKINSFSRDAGGQNYLLSLWELSGISGEITVTLPGDNRFTKAIPVNLRGEATGNPIRIIGNKLVFNLHAYAPASFILQ